jgi:O-antigen/teichoic acid export membrane protein
MSCGARGREANGVLRNIGSTWAVTVVTIGVTYFLMPFVLHTLGEDGYGSWMLINSITGYLGLLVLGVPMASVRYFAQHVAERDTRKLNDAIGSCIGLYLLMGAAALLVGVGLFAFFTLAYDIPAAWRSEAHMAFGLVVLSVAAGFVAMLPEGIFAAHHDFVLRNCVVLGRLLLRLGLTVVLLTLRASLVFLALVQIVCCVFEFSVSWFLIRRRYPGVRMKLTDFDWKMVRQIFAFSLYVLLLNVGGRLSFETDALVIGAFMDVGRIPFYTVANTLVIYLMEFVIAIAAVVMPMATKLKTEGRTSDLRDIFLKWSKIATSLTLMAGLFLIVLGPTFIGWWIGPDFEGPAGQVLQILMVSSLVFLPVRGVAQAILMGLGKPGIPTIAFLIAGILNLALSLVLVGPLGLTGVALGTAVPNVLYAGAVLIVACRELETGLLHYVRYVVLRAALGALPVAALLLWFRVGLGVSGLLGLVGAGFAMVILFAVMSVFFVYRNDPYLDLVGGLARLRAGSRA